MNYSKLFVVFMVLALPALAQEERCGCSKPRPVVVNPAPQQPVKPLKPVNRKVAQNDSKKECSQECNDAKECRKDAQA
jgi:hypothetical protein